MPLADDHQPVVVVREPGRTPLYLVLHDPLEVGRDCPGLLIDDPGVSRSHLQLRPAYGGVAVVDLESSNGTFLDGKRISDPEPLAPGSVVRLGDTTIELAGESAESPPTQPVSEPSSIDRVAAAVHADGAVPAVAARGDGTVTIAFTDIESSTELSTRMGDEQWFDVLSAHNAILRRHVMEHGGVEVKAQGDGFMLVFSSARRALMSMIAAQREISHGIGDGNVELRIRVGAHTGEAISDDSGDLFGYHVNLAARIANQAAGGEILVSSLLREIVEARGEFVFGEPREVELKGLTRTYLLHPVQWEGT